MSIAPHVREAIALAWKAFDDALDADDLALALQVLDGLDEQARAIGLSSAFQLPIRLEVR